MSGGRGSLSIDRANGRCERGVGRHCHSRAGGDPGMWSGYQGVGGEPSYWFPAFAGKTLGPGMTSELDMTLEPVMTIMVETLA